MKTTSLSVLTFLCLFVFSISSFASPNLPLVDLNKIEKKQTKKAEKLQFLTYLTGKSYEELMTITPAQVQEELGRKLTMGEKIKLNRVKRQANKHNRRVLKGKAEPQDFQFNVGGFLLGLFLGLIGILIALAFKDRENALISAAIGAGVTLVLVLILTLAAASSV